MTRGTGGGGGVAVARVTGCGVTCCKGIGLRVLRVSLAAWLSAAPCCLGGAVGGGGGGWNVGVGCGGGGGGGGGVGSGRGGAVGGGGGHVVQHR